VAKLTEIGLSKAQIDHLTSQIESQAQMAVPLLGQFVNDTLSLVIDVVLVVVLSIYLLVDGARFLEAAETKVY
jgi:predicted PurR-regulated permease PerM